MILWGGRHDRGLQVYQHDPSYAKDTLAVFIHGLNGRASRTWGKFPKLIASDPTFSTDYAFYDYLSLQRRWFRHAPRLSEVAMHLISQIRATEYRQVVLIGHSMGGNLARAAARYIHETSLRSNREYIKIQGLILFATPMLGSSYYPTQATKDGRLVAAYSSDLQDLMRFFNDKVDPMIDASSTDRINIPAFAAIALRDRVVMPMSSQELIPELQTTRVDSTHSGIVKPQDHDSASYKWLIDCLRKCTSQKSANVRLAETATDRIFARYSGSSKHADWQDKYLAACTAVEESDGIEIIDITSGEDMVNVAILVAEDEEITQGRYNQVMQQEARAQANYHLMSFYVGAIGANHNGAAIYAAQIIQPTNPGIARYFTGLTDATTLEDTISGWLHSVYARKRQSLLRRPGFGVSNDLPTPDSNGW